MSVLDVLQPVSFGKRVAEEEGANLASYFVETDHWRRLVSDDVDIIYGPKGSGKSALYSLLTARNSTLFDQHILLAPAENPSGTPIFKDLSIDPPATEREFIALWKLYFVGLVAAALTDYGISGDATKLLLNKLEETGIRPQSTNLKGLLMNALSYVQRIFRPAAVEGIVKVVPGTQIVSGYGGKILFSEPSPSQSQQGVYSIEQLFSLIDTALSESGYTLWVLLDRLDVAFIDTAELEENALRALFHVYLDLLGYKNIRLKIFLRTDIWHKITTSGFREASHITRHLTIEWNEGSLLNLIIRRVAQNQTIMEHYGVLRENILSSSENQVNFFYKVFPEQVEAGARKTTTFKWILARTCDGSRQPAPREIIHLLNQLRNVQVGHLERGDSEPDGGRLFSRSIFKEALPEVSRIRLQQTLYAEYPRARDLIKVLMKEKTEHTLGSLKSIWKLPLAETLENARFLVSIGFFEERGDKDKPKYWIPHLYRDALDLSQGSSE